MDIIHLKHLGATGAAGASTFNGATFQTLAGQFKGQSVPQVPYSTSNGESIRKYLDFYNEQLASGRSAFDTFDQCNLEPILMLPYAADVQNLDTNLILRTQMDEYSTNSLVHIGAVHDSVVVLNYNNDGSMMESCSYAVLS